MIRRVNRMFVPIFESLQLEGSYVRDVLYSPHSPGRGLWPCCPHFCTLTSGLQSPLNSLLSELSPELVCSGISGFRRVVPALGTGFLSLASQVVSLEGRFSVFAQDVYGQLFSFFSLRSARCCRGLELWMSPRNKGCFYNSQAPAQGAQGGKG